MLSTKTTLYQSSITLSSINLLQHDDHVYADVKTIFTGTSSLRGGVKTL